MRDETLPHRQVRAFRTPRVGMRAPQSAALAHGAEKSRPRPLHDAPDRRPASDARLARASVDLRVELELAGGAVSVAEIAQGRAAELDRACQRRSNRIGEQRGARAADAIAAHARIDAGFEQRLACVDVAGADDDLAAEERRLDGDAAPAQRGVEMRAVEAIVEGLEAEAARAASPRARRRPPSTTRRRRSGADR